MAIVSDRAQLEALALTTQRPSWPRRMVRLAGQHPTGVFGLVVMAGFVTLGLLGPYIAPHDPKEILAGPQFVGPSWDYPFGTAQFGEDMFSRVIAGARGFAHNRRRIARFLAPGWARFLGFSPATSP